MKIRQVEPIDVTQADWCAVERSHSRFGNHLQNENRVTCGVSIQTQNVNGRRKLKTYLIMRLGNKVIDDMGLEPGAQLLVCYDKNDLLSCMAFESQKGYKLLTERRDNKGMHRLTVPLDWIKLERSSGIDLDYKIDNQGRLFFRIPTITR